MVTYQPLFVSKYYSDCSFVWYQISAVHCLVLSQNTRVTDRQTELYDNYKYRASIAAHAVKAVSPAGPAYTYWTNILKPHTN